MFFEGEIWKCQEKTVYLQQILERYSPEARSSAFLSFSSYECRGNNAVITRLSRGNHALLDAKKTEIEYILRQDPRPGYQDNPERVYKMDYAGIRVSFKVQDSKVVVLTYEYF